MLTLLLITLSHLSWGMDDSDDSMEIDHNEHNTPSESTEPTQLESAYKLLPTKLIDKNIFTDKHRIENLRFIISNLNSNANAIAQIDMQNTEKKELIIKQLKELASKSTDLQSKLNNIDDLATDNKTTLRELIDNFCDREFEDFQQNASKKINELCNSQQATDDQLDKLLNMIKNVSINNANTDGLQ